MKRYQVRTRKSFDDVKLLGVRIAVAPFNDLSAGSNSASNPPMIVDGEGHYYGPFLNWGVRLLIWIPDSGLQTLPPKPRRWSTYLCSGENDNLRTIVATVTVRSRARWRRRKRKKTRDRERTCPASASSKIIGVSHIISMGEVGLQIERRLLQAVALSSMNWEGY
jgi:hypothetical protein